MVEKSDVEIAERLAAIVKHLIARNIALGCQEMVALSTCLPTLDPVTPHFGRVVGQLGLWGHLGCSSLEVLRDQLDRVDPCTEALMPAADQIWLELARAVHEFMTGEYDSALDRLQTKVWHSFVADRDPLLRTLAAYYAGRCHRRMGHDGSALEALRSALDLAMKEGWPAMAAVIRIQTAWLTYHHEGKGREAKNLLRESHDVLQATDDTTAKAYLLITEARIERRSGRYRTGIKQLNGAHALLIQASPTHPGITKVLLDLALVQRLQAGRDARRYDRLTASRRTRNNELRSVTQPRHFLERYGIVDAELEELLKDWRVNKFINRLCAAAAAAAVDDTRRAQLLAAIDKRRQRVERLLNRAERKSVDFANRRGLGTNAMYRAYLALDRRKLADAERYRIEALSRAEDRKDSFQIVRVKIVECQIALEWATVDPSDGTWLKRALDAAEMAVTTARTLENSRLIGRALTWLGIARATEGSAENLHLARAHADEAASLLGAAADYVRDDFLELQKKVRMPTTADQQIIALLDQTRALILRSRTLGKAIPTKGYYASFKVNLRWIVLDELLRVAGGERRWHRMAKTLGIPPATAQALRAQHRGGAGTSSPNS